MLDDLAGPGRLITGSAGNEGGNDTHSSDSLASVGDEDAVTVGVTSGNNVQLDFWYDGDDEFEFFVVTPANDTYGPFALGDACSGPGAPGCATDPDEGYINVNHRQDPVNGDNEISFIASSQDFSGAGGAPLPFATGTWTVRLRAVAITSSAVWHGWSNFHPFTAFIDPTMTLHEPTMAKNVISVAAHRTRTEFLAADGVTYNVFSGADDGIWPGSSQGPSRNPARTGVKPELSAPGSAVVSAMSSKNSPVALSSQSPDQQHNLVFATSYSAPHAAGALALALQANPSLTPSQADALIAGSSCPDADTCEDDTVTTPLPGLPDGVWGYGKLDALALVRDAFGAREGSFPSGDPADGKFIAVTGQGNATIDVPQLTLFVGVDGGASTVSVDIFDGDQTGAFDTSAGTPINTCFRLSTDRNKNGAQPSDTPPDKVVAEVVEDGATFFADNDFTALFSGPVDADALAPSGHYFYRLDVVNGDDCDSPDPTRTLVNGFKVRATGQVSLEFTPNFNRFSFFGADDAGPFASPNTFLANGVDTNYTGIFDFLFNVPTSAVPASIQLEDADADYRLDADAPGVAEGANEEIRYLVFNNIGALAALNTDVSGNFDVLAGDMDRETNVISTNGVGGLWRWRWDNVLTENSVHVWLPVTSPSALAMFAQPVTPLHVSAAQPVEFWTTGQADLSSHLPITLGTSSTSGVAVDSIELAEQLLAGDLRVVFETKGGKTTALCHVPPSNPSNRRTVSVGSSAVDDHLRHGDYIGPCDCASGSLDGMSELVAELLAVKLNISLELTFQSDLAAAFLYGHDKSVADVVAEADALVDAGFSLCDFSQSTNDEAAMLALFLTAINAAEVTYVAPQATSFVASAPLGQPTNPSRL